MQIKKLLLTIITGAFCVFINCSTTSFDVAGGGSDLEISACVIEGKAVDSLGNVLIGASVRLRPTEYLCRSPLDTCNEKIADAVTNVNGIYRFDSVDIGEYYIETVFQDSLGLLSSVSVVQNETTKHIQDSTLLPLATISGKINISTETNDSQMVLVFGLERNIVPDSSGYFSLKIPEGKYRLFFSADSSELTISVLSGEPKTIDIRINCDSITINDSVTLRTLLDNSGLSGLSFDSVATFEKGNVVYLDLSNRSIKQIDSLILKLCRLKVLNLSNNNLDDSVRLIFKLKDLEKLYLNGNKITTIPQGIGDLDNLKVLDVSSNKLTSLSSALTKHSLEYFNIANNFISIYSLSGYMITWLDENDPDWRTTQSELE